MSSLSLVFIPIEDFTLTIVSERADKFYEENETLPTEIWVTEEQLQVLRSPNFEPYKHWRGIPLIVV